MKAVIYIPTLERIGFNRQVTLREFLQFSSYKPRIVCPPDEVSEHMRYYKHVIACPAEGIGPTRQWIMDNSVADVVIMADDDMRFSYRPKPSVIKLERCEELDPMIDTIKRWVKRGIVHGGVGARQGNNRKDCGTRRKGEIYKGRLIQYNERVNNFHFAVPSAAKKVGARFDALPVMEDFHFTLTMLLGGQANVLIHDYVWNQEGSGSDGGCSGYRTPQVQAQGAEGLHAAYPDYVKVVEKTSKDSSNAWKDFKTRKDVIVQWLKAAEAGGSAK